MADSWRDWPHRWFGVYTAGSADGSRLPSREHFVDPIWAPDDLAGIVSYLRAAPICLCSQSEERRCRLCGEPLPEVATWRWYGQWLWPYHLFHDVEKHHLRLPDLKKYGTERFLRLYFACRPGRFAAACAEELGVELDALGPAFWAEVERSAGEAVPAKGE
jgi:hypothetical protein